MSGSDRQVETQTMIDCPSAYSCQRGSFPAHRKLSLEEKIEIIKEFERTKQRSHLARWMNCHVGQVNRTLQHKMELVSEYKRILAEGKIRKKRGACKVLKAVGTILNEFVLRCRFYPIQLNDEFLLEKAREIAKILNLSSFKGHKYWLKTFKHRFKLMDVDWSAWSKPYEGNLMPLDLDAIVEELRAAKGEKIIPYPTRMNQAEYEATVEELIKNSTPYAGYKQIGQESCTYYEDNPEIMEISDEELDGSSSYEESSLCDFDPTDLLAIENKQNIVDDPMNIDCYRTALSYFAPLEQFILSKQDNQILSLVCQLGKVLLKAAELEAEEDEPVENDQSTPSIVNEVQIEGYKDAVQYLHPLEEFVLEHENMRAVGLINQLEILLSDAKSVK